MAKLRVNCFGLSIDGYGAGPEQSLENPLGIGGMALHEWIFPTRTFRAMHRGDYTSQLIDKDAGDTGVDDDFAQRGMAGLGAWILGRNMFGPIRGAWPDEKWKGWWGDNPPYHTDVFVLTHHARDPITMQGGTTFYFVTDGIEAALKRAMDAAKGKDVRVGGGVATIQQYLRARLVDELHLTISPVLLGSGEALFRDINFKSLGYECIELAPSPKATHFVVARR
jgi:dihydrofolate reductase